MKLFIIGAAFIIALVCGLLWYAGFLEHPRIVEQEMGPYTMIYESFTGDYKKTKPVFDRVYENLKKEGLSATKGIGIYYDDPARVPAAQLRSDCGAVLEGAALGRIAELEKKYTIRHIAQAASVVAELPIRSPLSYMTGPLKAYPAMARYNQSKAYAIDRVYEIYDMQQRKISFVMTISTTAR